MLEDVATSQEGTTPGHQAVNHSRLTFDQFLNRGTASAVGNIVFHPLQTVLLFQIFTLHISHHYGCF
jgi:hypothetical protein